MMTGRGPPWQWRNPKRSAPTFVASFVEHFVAIPCGHSN
jgi:hypothetical protein